MGVSGRGETHFLADKKTSEASQDSRSLISMVVQQSMIGKKPG